MLSEEPTVHPGCVQTGSRAPPRRNPRPRRRRRHDGRGQAAYSGIGYRTIRTRARHPQRHERIMPGVRCARAPLHVRGTIRGGRGSTGRRSADSGLDQRVSRDRRHSRTHTVHPTQQPTAVDQCLGLHTHNRPAPGHP